MLYEGTRLSQDELDVLDYVTGLTPTLPEPRSTPCEDRWLAQDLSDQRLRVRALVAEAPPLRITFDDVVYEAATRRRGFNRIWKHWSLGLMMTVAFLSGVLSALWLDDGDPAFADNYGLTLPAEDVPNTLHSAELVLLS
jgi:predicted outer membrane lipoprotein